MGSREFEQGGWIVASALTLHWLVEYRVHFNVSIQDGQLRMLQQSLINNVYFLIWFDSNRYWSSFRQFSPHLDNWDGKNPAGCCEKWISRLSGWKRERDGRWMGGQSKEKCRGWCSALNQSRGEAFNDFLYWLLIITHPRTHRPPRHTHAVQTHTLKMEAAILRCYSVCISER